MSTYVSVEVKCPHCGAVQGRVNMDPYSQGGSISATCRKCGKRYKRYGRDGRIRIEKI